MKNFIQINIDKIKGSQRASSLIQRQPKYYSPAKNKKNNFDYSTTHKKQPHHHNIKDRINQIQQNLSDHSHNQLQILEDISEIKNDIKMIKSYLFNNGSSKNQNSIRNNSEEHAESNADDQRETYYSKGNYKMQQRMKSYGSEEDDRNRQTLKNSNSSSPHKRIYKMEEIIAQKQKYSKPDGISIKVLLTIVKDYKLQDPEYGTTFYGYSKRTSQPIALKYSFTSMDHIMEVYSRLWKNISKIQWPCINRIIDYKSNQEASILIMQKNISSIVNLPYEQIIIDIIKILQFIHDNGYLYRNIQPEHFMLNQDNKLVIIDFKRAKRYVDIRGNPIQVHDQIYTGSPFASNNQVRGLYQSRKDDLQSVGYLALLMYGLQIPWAGMTKQMVIKKRTGLTLQQIFKGHRQWMEYMGYVIKLGKQQRPDYRYLCDLIAGN